jgi:lipopolysaccharide export system protein LptC
MLCLTMLGMAFADSGFNFLKGAKAGSFEYFFYNDDGEKEWKLTGERPIFLENDDIRIENPILLLYSKDKKEHHSKIKADISILKGEKKLCSMQGNVIAKNAEGFSFSSALAKCDMKKKEITFPKKFKVLMNEIKMVGADGVLYMNKKLMMSKGKSKLEYTHVEKTK